MDLGLKGKVAFIAGSSRGIGEGIAHGFLSEGAKTVITGRGEAQLSQAKKSFKAKYGAENLLAIQGDLGELTTLKKAMHDTVAKFGTLDCVVVNVGSGKSVAGWDVPQDEWDSAFERNLWTSIHIAQEAMRILTPLNKGSIVFISSIAGTSPTIAPLPYSAAKAALVNYSANLSTLAAKNNIRVNCVAPGNILFPGGSWEKRLNERGDEIRHYIETTVPQNRLGTVEEIANVVTFLSSDRASFVTGACWTVDGGQTRKL